MLASLLALAQSPPPPVQVPQGTLVVHVVDSEGGLVIDDWVVSLAHDGGAARATPNAPLRKANIDSESGTVRWTHVPTGRYLVWAMHGSGDVTDTARVTLRGTEPTECVLTVPTTLPARCLFVVTTGDEVPDDLRLEAFGPDGSRYTFQALAEPWRRYVVRGVPPGRYTVRLSDPRFEPVEQADVLTGTPATLLLRARVTEVDPVAVLQFRCRATGVPLAPTSLSLDLCAHRALECKDDPTTDEVVLRGLPTGVALGVATFADRPPMRFRIDGLEQRTRRSVEVAVPRGAELVGRVVDALGRPAANLSVIAHATFECALDFETLVTFERAGAKWIQSPVRSPRRETSLEVPLQHATRTDENGRYQLEGLHSGAQRVALWTSPFTAEQLHVELGAEDLAVVAPEVRLGGSGNADVSVRLPPHAQLIQLSFHLQIGSQKSRPVARFAELETSRDGRTVTIRLRELPEEPCELIVRWRDRPFLGELRHRVGSVTFTPSARQPEAVTLDLDK